MTVNIDDLTPELELKEMSPEALISSIMMLVHDLGDEAYQLVADDPCTHSTVYCIEELERYRDEALRRMEARND